VPDAAPASADVPKSALRAVVGVFANVAVVTALLVYFGWRRSATQSAELGISESVLDMSTRDYVLRAVRPVFVLVVGAALLGLGWVVVDRRLRRAGGPFDPSGSPPSDVDVRTRVVHAMRWSVIALPAAALLVYLPSRSLGSVLVPAATGIAILLVFYAGHLDRVDADEDVDARRRNQTRAVCVVTLATACLFWTATNYADAEGRRHADAVDDDPRSLPRVLVYSTHRLVLSGPGVQEHPVAGDEGDFRYRYSGLRLLEHNGGTFFLISDGWTAERGVVIALPDDDPTVRFEFLTY
jgi:hypothetical protein